MTNSFKKCCITLLAVLPIGGSFAGASKSPDLSVEQVKSDMKRVADWQIEPKYMEQALFSRRVQKYALCCVNKFHANSRNGCEKLLNTSGIQYCSIIRPDNASEGLFDKRNL